MPTYTNGTAEVRAVVQEVMRQYHPDLEETEVTIGLLACEHGDNDDSTKPALKLHGYPCAATIQITPPKQRILGVPDAVLTYDALTWNGLKQAQRVALIDHELMHLELMYDDEGGVKSDKHGRPRLATRLHDVQLGVFDLIIKRHGNAAIDTQVVRDCHERYRQTAFAWSDDTADSDDVPTMDLSGAAK